MSFAFVVTAQTAGVAPPTEGACAHPAARQHGETARRIRAAGVLPADGDDRAAGCGFVRSTACVPTGESNRKPSARAAAPWADCATASPGAAARRGRCATRQPSAGAGGPWLQAAGNKMQSNSIHCQSNPWGSPSAAGTESLTKIRCRDRKILRLFLNKF